MSDYNPGITRERVFWTLPIDDDSVEIDDGGICLCVEDLPMPNYFDYENSLLNQLLDPPAKGIPPVPARVSFECVWRGVTRRVRVRDKANGFAGEFFETGATCAWSARQRGFRFASDPARTSTTVAALVGHERNGIFFR